MAVINIDPEDTYEVVSEQDGLGAVAAAEVESDRRAGWDAGSCQACPPLQQEVAMFGWFA
jgi:hypothetical protein